MIKQLEQLAETTNTKHCHLKMSLLSKISPKGKAGYSIALKIATCICMMACLWKCLIPHLQDWWPLCTEGSWFLFTRTACTCEVQQLGFWGCKGLALSHGLSLAFQGSLCPGDMAGAFRGPRKARVYITHIKLSSSPGSALCYCIKFLGPSKGLTFSVCTLKPAQMSL